jgi:hypothetical protein
MAFLLPIRKVLGWKLDPETDIYMNLEENGCETVKWIQSDEDMAQYERST